MFSECSPAAYQVKENGKYSTMQAHILFVHIPSTPGVGSKGQHICLLMKVGMLRIKLKEWNIEHHNS